MTDRRYSHHVLHKKEITLMAELKQERILLIELLKNLIREEKRGHLFFREAAKVSTDTKIIKLFEWLSEQERTHLEVLDALKSQVETEQMKTHREIAIDGQLVKILDLSDMTIDKEQLPHVDLFQNQDFVELLKTISIQSILQYAMRIEYENAVYIKDFIKRVNSRKIRDILVGLIKGNRPVNCILCKGFQI
jgi:rubrerythrin